MLRSLCGPAPPSTCHAERLAPHLFLPLPPRIATVVAESTLLPSSPCCPCRHCSQDGLIHISELRKAVQRGAQHAQQQQPQPQHQPQQPQQQGKGQQQGPQQDAHSLASVGDLLRVKVLSVDAKRGRINLAPI